MEKLLICDICGTSYADTEAKCPTCGYSRAFDEETFQSERPVKPHVKVRGGRYSKKNVLKRMMEKVDQEQPSEEAVQPAAAQTVKQIPASDLAAEMEAAMETAVVTPVVEEPAVEKAPEEPGWHVCDMLDRHDDIYRGPVRMETAVVPPVVEEPVAKKAPEEPAWHVCDTFDRHDDIYRGPVRPEDLYREPARPEDLYREPAKPAAADFETDMDERQILEQMVASLEAAEEAEAAAYEENAAQKPAKPSRQNGWLNAALVFASTVFALASGYLVVEYAVPVIQQMLGG